MCALLKHRMLISRSNSEIIHAAGNAPMHMRFLLCVVLVMEAEGADARSPKFSRLTDIPHSKHSICDIPGI